MEFKMFSVIVGTPACIAKCPFCVSCENIEEYKTAPSINWRNFDIACNLAGRSNVDTVMLTSRGEPLLFPEQITEYLQHLQKYKFPFVELQTNGILFTKNRQKLDEYARQWYSLGLTTITISVVSEQYDKNKANYCPNSNYIDLGELIKYLHGIGFSLRLTCILQRDITYTVDDIKSFIKYAKEQHVEQTTLRPLNREYRREIIKPYIENHLLKEEDVQSIRKYLEEEGTRVLDINRIGSIYDVNGQNVMLSVPLNMNTRDTNPENGRNLIFFQDGHLRYEWEKPGAILL